MNLLVEDRDGVRVLTLNRPEKRNALDTALTRALLEALRATDEDDDVRAVVLTGAGPAFCAGADLSEFEGLADPQAALEGDVAWGKVEAGQSAGLVHDIVPAGELVRRLVAEMEAARRRLASL